jgi:hypothetical protein
MTMRATLTVACGIVFFLAANAHAQEALNRCRQIKDDAARLKCYDGIGSASNAPARPAQGKADEAWEVRDERSPLDDSPVVTATLRSSADRASLLLRCKDRKTEVAVTKWGFIKCGTDVRVIYRVNQDQATDGPWNSHSSCVLALAPSPVPFIRALTDDGKVYFRIFDHHGTPHDALFNLGKVSDVRSRLAEACDWDGAAKATVNPGANAPTPAVPPSPSKPPQ